MCDLLGNEPSISRCCVDANRVRCANSKCFANEDSTCQREGSGPARYELYTKGEYALDRFVDPISGKNYNVDQLRKLDEDTFRSVFGS